MAFPPSALTLKTCGGFLKAFDEQDRSSALALRMHTHAGWTSVNFISPSSPGREWIIKAILTGELKSTKIMDVWGI